MSNFWELFEGEKTLQNALLYFVKKYNYEDSKDKKNFANEIIPQIIGKKFEERKMLELLEQELPKMDLTKNPKTATQKSKTVDEITIFDADKLDGFSFESFIANMLESNGFTEVSVTRGSGDQGGDILAVRGEEKLIIQAKRFSIDKKVTNSAVQEALGAIAWYNVNKGIVVTNSRFTNSAKELAKKNNIELWDRKTVSELIEGFNENQKSKNSQKTGSFDEYVETVSEKTILCTYCSYENSKNSKMCGKCGIVF